jgi:hypothetical protein
MPPSLSRREKKLVFISPLRWLKIERARNRRVGLPGNQPVHRARGARPRDDHGPVLGTLHDMSIAIDLETALLEADPAFRVTLDTMAF